MIKVWRVCKSFITRSMMSVLPWMWQRVWEQWSIPSAVWNNKETSTGKSVQFGKREASNTTFNNWVDLRTIRLSRLWASTIVDVPFQTGLVVWLLSLYPLRSSALEAKYCRYCDNDFVDEEDETRSSLRALILALGCEISANLEPHLKQNLSPGFTLAN